MPKRAAEPGSKSPNTNPVGEGTANVSFNADLELISRMESLVGEGDVKKSEWLRTILREAVEQGRVIRHQTTMKQDRLATPALHETAPIYQAAPKKAAPKRLVATPATRTIFRDIPFGEAPAGVPCIAELSGTIQVNAAKYPTADFALRVRGNSMTGRDIFDGDVLVFVGVEKQSAKAGDVVACHIDDEVTIKTLVKKNGRTTLKAENSAYPDPVVTKNSAVQGVMVGKL